MYIIINFILSLLLLCSFFLSRIEQDSSKSMSHISVRAFRSFISYPNSSLDKRNEAVSSFKILSSSALPGKSGITSICGAVMTGAIYFVQSCFPVLRQVRKHRKYEVAVYSFLFAILLLSYEVHWDLSCRRFQPETIFFLLAYHIQCCRFPYKKAPLSCASNQSPPLRY